MSNRMLVKVLVGVGVGGAAAGALYFLYKRWTNRDADEGFSEQKDSAEPLPKRILVLGLDGAGKSTLLACLSGQSQSISKPPPTEGFNVVSIQADKAPNLDIWEIGGAEEVRKYWPNFIQDTELLVYVIDSADKKRFPESYTEMHKLLGEPRLLEKPFLVIANKQDVDGAADKLEVKEALGLEDVKHHRVQIVKTTLFPMSSNNVAEIKELLLRL